MRLVNDAFMPVASLIIPWFPGGLLRPLVIVESLTLSLAPEHPRTTG